MIGLRTFRNTVTAALVIATPVATSAATRPNVAVPTAAAASSSAAQYENGNSMAGAWLPIGIIVATVIVGILLASKDSNSHGNLSRG